MGFYVSGREGSRRDHRRATRRCSATPTIPATATCSTSRRRRGVAYPEVAYFAGNSLGLQPKATRAELLEDLDAWARLGVEGHLEADRPWLPYHELLTEPPARLVGAQPREVVVMNSLTVNLHLLMVSFYRPTSESARGSSSRTRRSRPTVTPCAARRPSTGSTPTTTVVRTAAPTRSSTVLSSRHGDSVALVLLGGVNYLTGELLDIPAITAAGHAGGRDRRLGSRPRRRQRAARSCTSGTSTSRRGARTSTSTPGRARWPGRSSTSVTSARRHRRASRAGGAPTRRPASRWTPVARPPATAEAWQISNPPIFAMGPVRTSLELFDRVGMRRLARAQRAADRDIWRRCSTRSSQQPIDRHAARSRTPRCPALGARRRRRPRWPGGCATSTA